MHSGSYALYTVPNSMLADDVVIVLSYPPHSILTTPLIPTLASLFSPSQTIEISPSLNGRLWIQCPQSVVTVISLKRILEAVDEGLVGREVGELREWCGREGVVLT